MTNPVILISLDAVRPDHLGCYGYDKIKTPNIDEIASNGVLFENCITASCLTPVAMASTLTGVYPNRHGLRNPFCSVNFETVTEYFKKAGYETAGFVGIDFLNAARKFNMGFSVFKEPTEEVGWHKKNYKSQDGREIGTIWGYWWVDELLHFVEKNHDRNFFVWGHYFETHIAAERWLLGAGFIKEGLLADWDYYDAKIKCADDRLLNPLIDVLKRNGIWEQTTVVLMSDHGETFDEHPHKDSWAQHQSMYNTDLRNALIIKNEHLGKNVRVRNKVRTIDVFPTLLEIFHSEAPGRDGESLVPLVAKNKPTNRIAYSEELYELRGYGALQAIQDEKFKLMRNLSLGEEEFYNLAEDPLEKKNLIAKWQYQKLINNFREKLDEFLVTKVDNAPPFSREQEDEIKKRLKSLGYI
jgi:arylsulfatase A-like enzyme